MPAAGNAKRPTDFEPAFGVALLKGPASLLIHVPAISENHSPPTRRKILTRLGRSTGFVVKGIGASDRQRTSSNALRRSTEVLIIGKSNPTPERNSSGRFSSSTALIHALLCGIAF